MAVLRNTIVTSFKMTANQPFPEQAFVLFRCLNQLFSERYWPSISQLRYLLFSRKYNGILSAEILYNNSYWFFSKDLALFILSANYHPKPNALILNRPNRSSSNMPEILTYKIFSAKLMSPYWDQIEVLLLPIACLTLHPKIPEELFYWLIVTALPSAFLEGIVCNFSKKHHRCSCGE